MDDLLSSIRNDLLKICTQVNFIREVEPNDSTCKIISKKSPTEKKIIPNFLIDKNYENVDLKNLLKGLKLVTDYLEKTILKPNNLNLPNSRTHFVSLLK